MAITPFMSLSLPTTSVTLGPTYASMVNTAFTTLDSHNHSSGQGQQVPVSGLNINADLSLAGFNLTTARILKLQLQATAPALNTDIGCFYATTAGDVFWRNGSAQAVQITSGSGLAAVGTGSISGLAAPATASFSSSSGAFSWRSNTNVAAGMDGGPLTIRDTGAGALGITIASPAGISAAYTLTLPTALPANSGLVSLSTGGVLSVFGVVSGSALTLAGSLTLAGNAVFSGAGQAILSVSAVNAQLQLKGNKNATDTGTDVLTNTSVTRTAGNLFQVNNNGTAALNVDYQGLVTLASQTAPLQPAAYVTALTVTASWLGTNGVAYWKDASGLVRVKGTISDGIVPASNPAFTFPAGFRPSAQRQFSCPGAPAAGGTSNDIWQVTAAGALNLVTTHTALDAHFVDGISFLAEA